MQGCCCRKCIEPARLRRPHKAAGAYNLYGKWPTLVPTAGQGGDGCWQEGLLEAAAAMASGRGPGRLLRRQKRAAKLRSVHAAERAEKQARKAMSRVSNHA